MDEQEVFCECGHESWLHSPDGCFATGKFPNHFCACLKTEIQVLQSDPRTPAEKEADEAYTDYQNTIQSQLPK